MSDIDGIRFERGYQAGNYASVYVSENLDDAWDVSDYGGETITEAFRAGFVLGFFSSYEDHEVPLEARREVAEARMLMKQLDAGGA